MKRGAKSQAVRDYLSENPQASPKEVVEGLKAKGVTVKVTLVNSIKYKKPSKPGKRRAPSHRMAARRSSGAAVTVEQLLDVKRLADSLGGTGQVRRALETLEQLR
jgi:hypothetical protein